MIPNKTSEVSFLRLHVADCRETDCFLHIAITFAYLLHFQRSLYPNISN